MYLFKKPMVFSITQPELNNAQAVNQIKDNGMNPDKLFTTADKNTAEKIAAFKEYLETFTYPPTAAQSEMIFCSQRNANVIAGAGSGKSTTLILRVLFLVKVMGVPLDEITIFSFTKHSVREFSENLKKKLNEAGVTCTDEQVEKMVCTFYKKALTISRMRDKQAFDFLGKNNEKDVDSRGIPKNKPSTEQLGVLGEAYKYGYATDYAFRQAINALYLEEVRNGSKKEDEKKNSNNPYAEEQTTLRDEEVATFIRDNILRSNEPLVPFPLNQEGSLTRGNVVYANFEKVIDGQLHYCIFNPAKVLDKKGPFEALQDTPIAYKNADGQDRSCALKYCQSLRRRWILERSNQPVLFLDNIDDLNNIKRMSFEQGPLKPGAIPPYFSVNNKSTIFVTLFEQTGFMNNMAVSPEEVLDNVDSYSAFAKNKKEKLLITCAAHFHRIFYAFIKQKKLYCFDELFSDEEIVTNLPDKTLKSMRHLLIDEFQDISPQIANWILNIKAELHERPGCRDDQGSMMVVGDDYQSIYGWRGSSPDFFINYNKRFSFHSPVSIELNDNFRSSQHIIDDAEKTLVDISPVFKITKHGISSNKNPEYTDRLTSYPSEEVGGLLETAIVKSYLTKRDEFEETPTKKRKLFVLSRIGDLLETAAKQLTREGLKLGEDFETYTFHGSKGLEAEDVILIGDCAYYGTDVIRNFIYSLAGQVQSYDDAQKDEALRLAYVAITRAKQRVTWIGEPANDGVMTKFEK